MMMLPVASELAARAVADQFRYPATEEALPTPALAPAPVVRRSRARLSGVLHRAADAVAPAECSPAH